jgi:hypothetical protein
MAYGVNETNPISEGDRPPHNARTVDWTEKGLYITRFRLLSDPGFPYWDVSYCYGRIGTEQVRVSLPFSQLSKRKMKSEIIEAAKKDKVFAVGLGIFDNLSTLC